MLGPKIRFTDPMNSSPKTILIVEDEPAIAENIAFALRTENMVPLTAPTAGQARDILLRQPVDLLVLDVGLPDQSGFDFCRELRRTSSLPVIFLTARQQEIDRIVGLELGADDYLAKPFSPRELTARIRAVLRRTQPPPRPSAKQHPAFIIDPQQKRIFYQGVALDLSRYEFRILELLVHNPGRVFSRDQLMESAWEDPGSSCDRTIDTHIKTLRAKLRQIHPESSCLQTRRGWGYCLESSV
jgi:two-component system catabolic regulation response regulator CreB